MVELQAGDATVLVSAVSGGRLASIEVGGDELLVTGAPGDDPLSWGCYPMVPYAGRVRHGRFAWRGRTVELPVNLAPHAIHGSGVVSAWNVIDQGRDHAELETALTWSLGGKAHQHLQLTPQALVCVLTVTADRGPLPATIGWHPWFRKPRSAQLRFARMYAKDDEQIPTGVLVEPRPEPWDDCFVEPLGPLVLQVTPTVEVTVSSDCDHWVVYTEPDHATCVEPQSGPPDAFNLGLASVLEPGEMLQRTMTIAWSR